MRLPCSKLALSLCLALGSASAFAGSVSVDADTATAGVQAAGNIALNGSTTVNLVFNRAMPGEVVTSVSGNPGLSYDTAVFDASSNNGSCTVTDGTGTVAFIALDFAGLADGAVICTLTFTNISGADQDVEALTLSGVQPVGTTTADGQLTLQGVPPVQFTVTANGNAGGTVTPPTQDVNENTTADVVATPNAGFQVTAISGCGAGTPNPALPSNTAVTYTTAAVTADCTVTATFSAVPAPVLAAGGPTTLTCNGAGGAVVSTQATIRNSGNANLTGATCALSNVVGGTMVVSAQPSASIAPNATSSATVDCTVPATGQATGTLTCTAGNAPGSVVFNLSSTAPPPVTPPSIIPASSLWSKLGLAGLLAVLGLIAVGFRRQH